MEENYKKAFAEVIKILNHTDKEITEKISKSFIEFLIQNMDKDYPVKIDFTDENWEDTTLVETRAIIALIYRDYILSDEEREKLLLEENQENNVVEEKFNSEQLFKDIPKEVKKEQLIEVEKYPWYKRLYNKIIKFFKGESK